MSILPPPRSEASISFLQHSAFQHGIEEGRRQEREGLKTLLRSQAAHIKENAEALRKFDWQGNEARCRELCAMYLDETAHIMDLDDKLRAIQAIPVAQTSRGIS